MKKIILMVLIFILGFLSGILIYSIFFYFSKTKYNKEKTSSKKEQKINISPNNKISVALTPSDFPVNENNNQNSDSLPLIKINSQPQTN